MGIKLGSNYGFDFHFPNDAQCMFVCLLDICVSSQEKWWFKSFADILIRFFGILFSTYKNSLYILATRP